MRQSFDKLDVACQKIVFWQLFASHPHDLREIEVDYLARELAHAEKDQPERRALAIAKIIALNFSADASLDAQLLTQLAGQRRARLLAGLDLTAREFPLAGMAPSRQTLPDQNHFSFRTVALDHRCHDFHHCRFCNHSAIIETRMHSERLLDHFRSPRNPGELTPPAVKVDVTNPACGDMLRLSARFEGGRVAEARFLTRGCTASIAASSALTEWMIGKTSAELAVLRTPVIEEAVGGLEPASKHAAVLCVDAVRALLGHRPSESE